MSSNEQKPNLGDAKNLHKTSVSNEVVIRFSHVTKTYNLYKNDKARFLGIFNYQKKGMFLGSVNPLKSEKAKRWLFWAAMAPAKARR